MEIDPIKWKSVRTMEISPNKKWKSDRHGFYVIGMDFRFYVIGPSAWILRNQSAWDPRHRMRNNVPGHPRTHFGPTSGLSTRTRVRDQQNWADFGIFPSVPEYRMSRSKSSSEGQKFGFHILAGRNVVHAIPRGAPTSVPDRPTGSGGGRRNGFEMDSDSFAS